MSAICGIFQPDAGLVSNEAGAAMMDAMGFYSTDATGIWNEGPVFLGCCLQHITPESLLEELPLCDISTGLAITADALLDNRPELASLLGISAAELGETADSRLILRAYEKWGEDCPKYLAGDFSFVIWDARKRELFCARDHTGNRTLYFHHSPHIFLFSTVMKPITAVLGSGLPWNEAWIADFLSLSGVLHEADGSRTIYRDIEQLLPAHTLVVGAAGIRRAKYWHPLQVRELRLKSDEAYAEAFREVFFEAVRCRLRSVGQVGIMLSGGLDSGSVASVAARELAKQGKRLKAFSSVPMESYRNWLPKRLLADERQYTEVYKEFFDNIDIQYCSSEGRNSFAGIDRFLRILEQPYKIVENIFWVDELEAKAAAGGCKVLLDGQFGNLTISYGDLLTHVLTLLKQFRWGAVIREISGYSYLHRHNAFLVAGFVAGRILKHNVLNACFRPGRQADFVQGIPINRGLAAKWNTRERTALAGTGHNPARVRDLAEARKIITNNVFFSHLGPLDTKSSLANGIARRDPTRDKRVIEFCMSLPCDQFVRNGQERYLIRHAMAGVLPDPIRTNIRVRGKQSADWVQRLAPVWGEIRQEVSTLLEHAEMEHYLDFPRIRKALDSLGDCVDRETSGVEIRMLLISLIFYYFITGHYQNR